MSEPKVSFNLFNPFSLLLIFFLPVMLKFWSFFLILLRIQFLLPFFFFITKLIPLVKGLKFQTIVLLLFYAFGIIFIFLPFFHCSIRLKVKLLSLISRGRWDIRDGYFWVFFPERWIYFEIKNCNLGWCLYDCLKSCWG